MPRAFVGVDVGTQSLKAVVTDDRLAALGAGHVRYPVEFPRPGFAQQAPQAWDAALGPAIAAALAAAGRAPADVVALGVTGQLDGCVAVDADGRALAPCLVWMDRRAAAELPALDPAALRRRTGVTLDASHMAAKLRWLDRHVAGLDQARFHQPVSYLVERLTGAYLFDHALASTTMLYDLATRDLAPDLLAAFDVARARLPALADAASLAGTLHPGGAALTGLPVGLPVAVGTGDDFTSALGVGLHAPGRAVCVLGTAEVVGALAAAPVFDPAGLVECHGFPGGGFFVENPGWLSGGALTWLGGILGVASAAELDALAAPIAPGADGLSFLPALSGLMAPAWNAAARGCFYGLTPAHGRGHLVRAVLEAMAFAMRDVLERLAELGVAVDRVVLTGGGAASALWAQMRADVSGLAVELAAEHDAAPIGAALLAQVACGQRPSIAAAAAELPRPSATVRPEPGRRPAYDDAHGRYRQLWQALEPMVARAAQPSTQKR